MSQSTQGDWIWCQEVLNGRYFWMHSVTKSITYTPPSNIDLNLLTTHNRNRKSTPISPNLHQQKSITPPPGLYRNNTSQKSSPQKRGSKADDSITHSKSLNKKKSLKTRRTLRPQPSMQRGQRINESMDLSSIDMYDAVSKRLSISKVSMTKESIYDIKVNADMDAVLQELLGYDILDIRQSILDNDYVKSDINSFLLYRYQSSCISHIKEFKPPLNDTFKEIKYFRNIEYPQYTLETNLNIQKIIEGTYEDQKPYLRIRIPVNINVNILGNKNFRNHQKSVAKLLGRSFMNSSDEKGNIHDEIFNIVLSSENLSNITVQDFFHIVAKLASGVKDDEEIKRLFLGTGNNESYTEEEEEDEYYEHFLDDNNAQHDWSKLAIKANGFEEYIFYSMDGNDKICNYECVRQALLHQLDKMDKNTCFLTLVHLDDFDSKIEQLKMKYINYTEYVSDWRKGVENFCFQRQFNTNYPYLNCINKQFFNHYEYLNYKKMNDDILEWKKRYDVKYPNNNIILLQDYKSLFEYTIFSITNCDQLPRYDKHKYSCIVVSFELQIGNTSYEQDLWFTRPKSLKKHQNKIVFRNAIYKSKHLTINTFPREIILSVIVFGIPQTTKHSDIQSVIDSTHAPKSDSNQSIIPEWFLENHNDDDESQYPDLLIQEQPIDLHKFSLSSFFHKEEEDKKSDDGKEVDEIDETDVFYKAFKNCDALAYLRVPLIDDFHTYREGKFTFNLWDIPKWDGPSKAEPRDRYGHDLQWRFIQPCSCPPSETTLTNTNQCQISLIIGQNPENDPNYLPFKAISPLFNHVMPGSDATYAKFVGRPKAKSTFSNKEYKKLDQIIRKDPLSSLSNKEKYLIWISRESLSRTKPRGLPVFLNCVDWRNQYFRSEAYKYLYKWKLPNLETDLIELLISWNFPDNRIKHFVVMKCLNKLNDAQINEILLQLVQIIKLEAHNFSFISNCLIQRALRSVTRIGHYLYWFLKSEIDHSHKNYTRFSLIVEDFLIHCFNYPSKLYIQKRIVGGFTEVSRTVQQKLKQNADNKDEIRQRMYMILKRMNKSIKKFKNGISIPLNPKYKIRQLKIGKCRFMGSAQAPLWLEFENSDKYALHTTKVLFKCGDDLRQDVLTLQIMNSMNKFWLTSGHCMRFRIYCVITTSSKSGFIEIVTNSKTFDYLSKNYGGGILKGVKNETVHVKYIRDKHVISKERELAQKRYVESCAGYCMASWIIGIGDRHSDNIMVHECGDLFHIDFGHFLGHFKVKKFEISKKVTFEWKRERSPFVFLPAMKYCIKYDFKQNKIGIKDDKKNENYIRFINLCTTAIDAIKRKQKMLINLFILMLPSQMPELLDIKDIIYMRDQINPQININDDTQKKYVNQYDKLREYVEKQFDNSFNDGVRILDHIAHAWVHSK